MKVKLNGNDWYKVTSDFAEIDSAHSTPHTGIDLAMEEGTEIFSPVNGVIEDVVNYGDKNIGKGLLISTEDQETLVLGHLSEIDVEVGDQINVGDLIALSGNTGNSTGAHLHIGLQDIDGNFLNPEKFIFSFEPVSLSDFFFGFIPDSQKGSIPILFEEGKGDVMIAKNGEIITDDGGIFSSGNPNDVLNLFEFIEVWRNEGFFYAIYGDSFFNVVKNFFKELFHDMGVFILSNGDIFFLAPAIIFMFGTFMIGQNKFTKWIIPLWFAYFLTSFFHKMMIN